MNNNAINRSRALRAAVMLAVAAAAAGAATSANAQSAYRSSSVTNWYDDYYYLGLAGGQSTFQFHEQNIVSGRLSPGVIGSGITSHDNKDSAFRIFGGYQFNRFWALEAAYFDLGNSKFSSSIYPTGTFNGEIKVRGGSLDLVGTLPLGERFAVLGRIGGHYSRTQDAFNGTGNASNVGGSPSTRKTDGKVGGGLQYAFSEGFMMRLEGERYRVANAVGGKGYINTAMLSLVFPFDRARPPAPTTVAAAPAPYVAPTPPPPPAPVYVAPTPPPAPPPPAMRRVTFSAESLFGFDKSELRPEGMRSLDALAAELQTTRYDTVRIIGHTDRLGTPAYNQALSQRRAEAVRSYLVTSGRVDASRISATGMGEETAVTKPGECKGNKANPKLVACLQADRRVDVEVTGMR
jgi:OOP family OmpA-OmpF porin